MLGIITSRPFITGLRSAIVDTNLWEELSACPICRRADHLRDIGSVEGDLPGTVAAVCLDCEHGFLRRRPVKKWYDEFYSKDWDQEGKAWMTEGEVPIHHVPEPYPFLFCSRYLPNPTNVLDVGAGFGRVLLPFQKHGHRVNGIERSEHRAKYLRDVLGIPCVNAAIECFNLAGEFGLICMNHVLEHVADPVQVIGILAAGLPEDGMIYIAVPDFWRAEYPPQAFHFVPHLSWFTMKSLRRLLTMNGLHILGTAENKEIQVLAKKSDLPVEDGEVSDPDSRSAFWQKTSASVLQAFGGKPGSHNLIWFIDNDHQIWFYGRRSLSGPRLISSFVKASIAMNNCLPNSVRDRVGRFLPHCVTTDKPRILTIDLQGDMTLPLTLKYSNLHAPVWIK